MSKEIVELAIRSPKSGITDKEFVHAKNEAVKNLVRMKGIGPEREFYPFLTVPETNSNVYVGMTKYSSQGKVYRALLNLRFITKLMKFMKKMNPYVGVFMQPNESHFDYLNFANTQNITEIALLKPKNGVSVELFLQARADFLKKIDQEPEVEKSYTFNVTGGFKGKNTHPHFTVYKSKEAFDQLTKRANSIPYFQEFFKTFDIEILCFCTTIK
jgi:hypothetical protein